MRNGQLGASFQWLYVLLAGGAFLLMFFLLVRGCAQQGESKVDALAVTSLASRLQTATWQPESNMTVSGDAQVSCPAGVLTLTGSFESASIERAAVFLPPTINGKLDVVIREISLSDKGSPPMSLGNVLYGLDQDTYYINIVDASSAYDVLGRFFAGHRNVITVPVTDSTDGEALADAIPRSARHVVLVTDSSPGYLANTDISAIPSDSTVRGVYVEPGRVDFYSRQGGLLVATERAPAEHDYLALGAIITGDAQLYRCAREQFVLRSRTLTQLYERRATLLIEDMAFSSCLTTLESARATLAQVHTEQDYVNALFRESRGLSAFQAALLARSCPVIA